MPLDVRLERGELVSLGSCPFLLPTGDDLAFLLQQRLGRVTHKNISYNPHTGKAAGNRELPMMSAVARVRLGHLSDADLNALYDYLAARGRKLTGSGS